MSRLRALLSPDPLDREIAQRVDRARREIFGALERCNPRSEADILRRRRMQFTRKDLERILAVMDSVRRVGTSYEVETTPVAPKEKPPKTSPTPETPVE